MSVVLFPLFCFLSSWYAVVNAQFINSDRQSFLCFCSNNITKGWEDEWPFLSKARKREVMKTVLDSKLCSCSRMQCLVSGKHVTHVNFFDLSLTSVSFFVETTKRSRVVCFFTITRLFFRSFLSVLSFYEHKTVYFCDRKYSVWNTLRRTCIAFWLKEVDTSSCLDLNFKKVPLTELNCLWKRGKGFLWEQFVSSFILVFSHSMILFDLLFVFEI